MEWTSNICFCKGFTNSEVRTNCNQIQFPSSWKQCEALHFFLRIMHSIIFHLQSYCKICVHNQYGVTSSTHFAYFYFRAMCYDSFPCQNQFVGIHDNIFRTIKWEVTLVVHLVKGSTMLFCIIFEPVI
jgi:hypothetical protein